MPDDSYDPAKAIGPDRRTYQQYLDERKLLIESERAAGDNFDKVLLALSAGSVALSVTFVEKIGAAGVAKPLLYIAWAVLAAALIANLRSFMVLQQSIARVMEVNDLMWELGPCDMSNPYQRQIKLLNQWSFRLFMAGIILLLAFAAINYQASDSQMRGGATMSDDNKSNKSYEPEVKKSAGGPSVVKLPPPRQPKQDSSGGSGNAGGGSKK